ncbi:2OG-Fe dioxygenase family protein [Bombella pollinis]|uniref:2OG-Fe dioxygenase family protein n=1 Tax=Bombella pollinis TaxID=2967337 RepID=A0ABT3WKE7_9PROT|nr:2OG-Fe dioxygenase family protein [Bombella pollinis]MCX5619580.1 2OG-Fe dioxygenase family protein [Bombella pollinis]
MTSTLRHATQKQLHQQGFLHLPAADAKAWLQPYGLRDWESFATSWNHLGMDRYMADNGRYRRRRYGTFSINKGQITRKEHQPHYQSRDYNLLNGGVERWFNPIEEAICAHPALQAILKASAVVADQLAQDHARPASWHVEVHQFRIEAATDAAGRPTPEGMHRDGVDWVFVFMINRINIREGVTSIHALDKETQLGSFTLKDPLDTAIVNDHRVYHGVTPVEPEDPTKPAYRDVLVVTLRYE